MNTEKLLAAVKYFEKEPLRFNMRDWIQRLNPNPDPHTPPCHTAACIAGSLIILEAKAQNMGVVDYIYANRTNRDGAGWYEKKAAEILEIDENQARRLFYTEQWPINYKQDYDHFDDDFCFCQHPHLISYIKRQMVRVLQQRVATFIATNGNS